MSTVSKARDYVVTYRQRDIYGFVREFCIDQQVVDMDARGIKAACDDAFNGDMCLGMPLGDVNDNLEVLARFVSFSIGLASFFSASIVQLIASPSWTIARTFCNISTLDVVTQYDRFQYRDDCRIAAYDGMAESSDQNLMILGFTVIAPCGNTSLFGPEMDDERSVFEAAGVTMSREQYERQSASANTLRHPEHSRQFLISQGWTHDHLTHDPVEDAHWVSMSTR